MNANTIKVKSASRSYSAPKLSNFGSVSSLTLDGKGKGKGKGKGNNGVS